MGAKYSPSNNLGTIALTGVTYDGSNRCTGYVQGGITYTITYPTGKIVVTGSDGTLKTITLDGSGRISAVS